MYARRKDKTATRAKNTTSNAGLSKIYFPTTNQTPSRIMTWIKKTRKDNLDKVVMTEIPRLTVVNQ
jgi:hypothetical protein